MNENHLEVACLDWLGSLGWTCLHGDVVSPGGEQAARERYAEVVLAPRLREAATRLNPTLVPTEVDEVVAKVASYGSQSLVDGNREMYDWLRNGVPLERIESDGRRSVLRVPVIDFDGPNDLLAVQQFTVHGRPPTPGWPASP
ncbi:MAG: type I restriction endonuclease [Xanthomonadaceae bacterium]|nr:type I restriction endonuclease [Xanthomonadaceae bacterium]